MICILCTQQVADNSNWFAELVRNYGQIISTLAQILITGFIGCAAWYISAKQAEIAKAKLNYEMYQDRKEIYIKIVTYLYDPVKSDFDELNFILLIPQSRFLFNEEIANFVRTIAHKKLKIDALKRVCSTDIMSPQQEKEMDELILWCKNQNGQMKDLFREYFDFSTPIKLPFKKSRKK